MLCDLHAIWQRIQGECSTFPLFQNEKGCRSNAEMANSPNWLVEIDPEANKLCQRQESRMCDNYKVSNACLRLGKLQKEALQKRKMSTSSGLLLENSGPTFLNELFVSFFCYQSIPQMHWCRLLPIETSSMHFKHAGKIFIWKQNCLLTVLRAAETRMYSSGLVEDNFNSSPKVTRFLMQYEVKTLRHTSKQLWWCSEREFQGWVETSCSVRGRAIRTFFVE